MKVIQFTDALTSLKLFDANALCVFNDFSLLRKQNSHNGQVDIEIE